MSVNPCIVMVGAGRIAWSLGKRLKSKGLPVAQVVSRTAARAAELGGVLGCNWTADYAEIRPDADWVIIAVSDDVIGEVAAQIAPYLTDALVTHTSGATPGDVLAPYIPRYGVFYPLQSFSKERQPVWSKIPFCVNASGAEEVLFLRKMAKRIGNLVYQVNDQQRAVLHVAAVYANNFTNYCFAVAEKILDDADLPFEMLHPLMEETLAKAITDMPSRMQTGPAIRGDRETIEKHLLLLEKYPEWQGIYRVISEDISKMRILKNA